MPLIAPAAAAVGWARVQAADAGVLRFRRAFALVWLTYDLCDLAMGGTASYFGWLGGGGPMLLTVVQVSLIMAQAGMALGRPAAPVFALMAALLRGLQLTVYPINDYFYYVVVCVLLAFPGNPRWRRDLLLAQTAWIYLATAVLKLNQEWLSGGHLFVRINYLWDAHGWPHLRALTACTDSMACLRVVAMGAIGAELALAALLILPWRSRYRRPLAIALAVGIHLFAALTVNVWFFGASMIAQVVFLVPGFAPGPAATAPAAGAPRLR